MDIQQVAKRAKVSTATVSRVLNRSSNVREKTSAHVRRIIEELNYVPNTNARNLRVGRTRLFGLIISDINNPFFPELIDAFEGLAAEQGIEVIFTHTNYDPRRLQNCVRRLVERNVDAIAIMTSEVDEQALQEATKVQLPLVLLNQRSLQDKYRNVMVEYSRGFQEAVEHLRALGHTAIGFIAGPSHLRSAQRRREAFCLALKRCSLEVCPEWIATTDLRVEGGKIAMQQLLALGHRPTAVVTYGGRSIASSPPSRGFRSERFVRDWLRRPANRRHDFSCPDDDSVTQERDRASCLYQPARGYKDN